MKKVFTLVLALCMLVFASFSAFAAAETQVSISIDNLGRGKALADLGLKVTAGTDGSITSDGTNISFYLPEPVLGGETVTVHVTGSSDGDFRMWLIDINETTNSDIYQMSQHEFTSGEFDLVFELTATAESTEFFFKAPTWDGKIENLNVKYLSVTKGTMAETGIKAASGAAAETPAAATSTKATPKTGEISSAVPYAGLMAAAMMGYAVTKKKSAKK